MPTNRSMAPPNFVSKEELPPNIVMKDCNTFYCKCCSCILGGVGCMKQHVAGKRHKKEMQRIGATVPPPRNEVNEAGVRPTVDFYSLDLPQGVIESKERWKSFYCTYCNCELGANDMKIHVVGKRHTKKANKVALENFMNKQEAENTFEVRDEKMAREVIGEVAPKVDSRKVASTGTEYTTVCTKLSNLENTAKSSSAENVHQKAVPIKTGLDAKASVGNTVKNVTHQFSSKVSIEDSTTKSDLPAGTLVTDVPQKGACQDDRSVKSSQIADSTKDMSEKPVSGKLSQTIASKSNNLQMLSPENVTQQATVPPKTYLRTNDSVKDTPQNSPNNAACKSSSAAVIPTTASQEKTLVKEASQTSPFGKSTLVKIVPQAKFPAKPTLQTRIPLQTSSQLKTSLSEYFATVSNPIVGLNYVEESQMEEGHQSFFHCNLCDVGGDADVIKDHINATKHHWEYLRTVDPIKAAEVKDLKDTERNQKILEHVIELERKKGRGTILVKTAKMKTATGNDEDGKNNLVSIPTPRKNLESRIVGHSGAGNSSIQIVAQEFLTKDVIHKAQSRDPKTSKIIKELANRPNSSYIMHDGMLYERRNGKYRVVVAQAMKQAIYESYHFSLCRKTPGGVTYINDSYSWSGINEDIAKFAKQCYICQIRKLRQFSDGEAIPILVRRGRGKKALSPARRAFNDLTNEEIEETQRKDPDTTKIISEVENGLEANKYIVYENILYIVDENGQYKIVASPQMKKLIFEKNHNMLCWKSTERPPLINAITQVYFWQRMLEEVKSFAAKCKKCRINIPMKRISDQKNSFSSSAKVAKKTTEKTQDEVDKNEPKRKLQKSSSKDASKERPRERNRSKEKSPRNSSWDKTKNLKPPIIEQDILTKEFVRDAQKKDLTTSKIIKLLTDGIPSSSYILYEGVLYQEKNEKYRTMVADKMKQAIYEKCHSYLCSRQTTRSSQRNGTKYISRHFSWSAMSQDMYIFMKNCHVCQVRTLRTKAFSSPLSKGRYNNKVLVSASRSAFTDLTDDEINNSQQKDPDTLKILHQLEEGLHVSRYILYEGILYHQGPHGDYKIVTTPEMKERIYQNNHFLLCWESTGWQDSVEMVAQIYLWPRIDEDVRDFMENCQVCKRSFPEQSYSDPSTLATTFPDRDKTPNLMEQYPSYSDPAFCSSAHQFQSNAVQPVVPYSAADPAMSSYGSHPSCWDSSSDAYTAFNSGKRPLGEDMDHSDSYGRRKRHRLERPDMDAEYDYSRSQDDRHDMTSFETKKHLEPNKPQFQGSLPPYSEVNKPHRADNPSNVLGFTVNNAEDAEVTLDIINSLMQIYLKYQLKKLHGPVQKLLQESLEGDTGTTLGKSSVSERTDALETSELFVRLPRLKKGERADPARTLDERRRKPTFGQPLYNRHMYTSASKTFKSDTFFKTSSNLLRGDGTNTLPELAPEMRDDDIDGFPMTSETPDLVDKVQSRWDDDIDSKPSLAELSENSDNRGQKDNLIRSPNSSRSLYLSKSFQDKNDGVPFGFGTGSSLNKLRRDPDISSKKSSNSSDKLGATDNESEDDLFLKPDSGKIFKKPPDDWDKIRNKIPGTTKNNPSTKPKTNWGETGDHDVLDTRTLSDKYPKWKKNEIQGGFGFYNSLSCSKVGESSSSSNNNAPVIDLFRRYRRVQL